MNFLKSIKGSKKKGIKSNKKKKVQNTCQHENMAIYKRSTKSYYFMTWENEYCVVYSPRNELILNTNIRNHITFLLNLGWTNYEQIFILPSFNTITNDLIEKYSYDKVTDKDTIINREKIIPSLTSLGPYYSYTLNLPNKKNIIIKNIYYNKFQAIITSGGYLNRLIFFPRQ